MEPQVHELQNTNDRFHGNIQRSGTFLVNPRISGRETFQDKLVVIGEVAQKYESYTEVTGDKVLIWLT